MPPYPALDDAMTINAIMTKCPQLGIPHFQRGLVWDDGAVSLLLESLLLDTPIGSFVLWQCDDQEQGISWLGGGTFDHLIIDGQQRIRSLHRVLICEGGEEPANDGEKGSRAWCVNLRRTPEFARYFEHTPKEPPLFVNVLEKELRDQTTDERPEPSANRPSRYQKNFVRLQWLRAGMVDEVMGRIHVEKADSSELRAGVDRLIERVRFMSERRVFVRIERERSLSEIVGIYNRINNAGKRVESEERAFATLVALDPRTGQYIENLFRQIHGVPPPGTMERDHALRRQKERTFGFKFFMRTFAQVCGYHFGSQSGTESFSFDFFLSTTFAAKAKTADLKSLWDLTAELVEYVHGILTRDLCCDDLRFLPETSSLAPVLQFLIRYPDVMDASRPDYQVFRRKVSALCLQLVLAEHPQNKIAALVRMACEARAKDGGETLAKMLEYGRGRCLDQKTLVERLHGANSLQDRYVLLLYWLERSRAARDFSYSKNEKRLARPDRFRGSVEALIDCRAEAERQHLCPYSELKGLYSELRELAGRMATHRANNIGNITYISRKLNSFKDGIGENVLDLTDEDPVNLRAHFLEGNSLRTDTEAAFESFCRGRAQTIAVGFMAWQGKLRDESRVESPEGARVKPARPRYADYAHLADDIRRFQLDDEVEGLLIDISGNCKRKPGRRTFAGMRIEKKGLFVITLHTNTNTIEIRPETEKLATELRTATPGIPWAKGRDMAPAVLCSQALKVLISACR